MMFPIAGPGIFMFGVVMLGERVVRAELANWLGKRKTTATIESMQQHYIVRGCGRFGQRLCEELKPRGMPFVVVGNDRAVAELCRMPAIRELLQQALAEG